MKQGQFPAVFNLTDLNGQNGFKIDGENYHDYSGHSISAAGDINGDGYADLLIGAYGYPQGSYKGRSYVVFGGASVGNYGVIALSTLNGAGGFKLDGENNGDGSGFSVSIVGDINGDGHDDLLIGACQYPGGINKGRSYVVFGGLGGGIGNNGVIALSSLNVTQGFRLDGENNGDQMGTSVSAAGDINGDSHADLLIGAQGYPAGNGTGSSYVVFGGPGVGSSGDIALASLNGMNGFKLDGENNNDNSGYVVSTAGDVNGDGHVDLLIGAHSYLGWKGRSYIVFGGTKVGMNNNGTIALASLNGTDGFKLTGENNNDWSGYSVSTAGDINDDGHTDFIIGAPNYNANIGRSYLIFGGTQSVTNGSLALSSLNGMNGFKLDGEVSTGGAGSSGARVGTGDINGDGYADLLIGAYEMDTEGYAYSGRGYVVFGGPQVGNGGLIPLSNLNGINGFKIDGEGSYDQAGFPIQGVGDMNGDGIEDFAIGAFNASRNGLVQVGCTYVVFGDVPPLLINNSLSLSVGATITLNATYLAATDRNHNNNTLVFIPSGVAHGQFEAISNPGVPLINFTQKQVTSGAIQFVHDGTLVPPSYNITVRSTGIAWAGPIPAQVNFIGTPQSYFPAILPLASLNGQNGFKLDGENNVDQSGGVSAAGDINGDGNNDFLITARGYLAGSNKGRSYVVFGGPGVGNGGNILLSALNGTNGFKLDGENNGDRSSWSVSAGDINADGYSDMLIGAWGYSAGYNKGRSYVVFGGSQVGKGNNGVILLSSLNGTNGFKMDGENNLDWSGDSGFVTDDINGDGYKDLIVGATLYPASNAKGRIYIVFGGPNVQSSGDILLSSLNGTNGFKLDGENNKDNSGNSVSTAGDINGDGHADLLIGAYGYPAGNYKGRSYIMFGGSGVGSSGDILLSSLNGTNGFKLDGENNNDQSSYSVSAAGDINGDGIADLVIGAVGYPAGNYKGRSYIMFGGSGVGSSGDILLSSLNGTNGFKLDGENNNDQSGCSVSVAGDINGDGYGDLLVGAPLRNNSTGRSYVVFGGPTVGSSGLLALSSLNGANGFKLDGENSNDYSGWSVSVAGDINGDGIADLLIGAYGYPAGSAKGRTYVIFGDAPPTLIQNRLSLTLGQTIQLNQTYLSAYDRNNPNNTIVFIPSNVTHGHFQLVTQPGVFLANFTLPQLQSGVVQFAHDGSITAPSYNITVQSAGIAWTGPYPANISFTIPLTIITNQLTLNNGQTVVLSSNNLQAIEQGVNNSQLTFTVGNVQNGYFATVPSSNNPSKNLTSFTQAQIVNGSIEFISAGNKQTPSYSVVASDGMQSTLPSSATIDFIGAPNITQNSVNITVGSTITLTPAMLNVTAPSGVAPNQVSLAVTNLQHATITSTLTHAPVSNFTLAEVEAGDIQLTQDSSSVTPSYTITATIIITDFSSAPDSADVLLSDQGVYAPQLMNNYLEITQGKATTLSNRYLSAQEPPNGQAPGNNTMFYVSNIEYGHFSLISRPQTWITSFSQQQLLENQVQFVQDGSASAPGYQSQVEASNLLSASLPASIFFTPVNEAPPTPTPMGGDSGYSTVQKAIISAVISGGFGIGFALIQICLKRLSNRKLLQVLGEDKDDYDLKVVRPVAKEIAGRIKITGFLNATTNTRMRSFKSAVRSLLSELSAKGVNVHLNEDGGSGQRRVDQRNRQPDLPLGEIKTAWLHGVLSGICCLFQTADSAGGVARCRRRNCE